METFILAIIILSLALTFMAVGVIFSNKELKGSCGGLGNVMGDECMFCDKKEQCEKTKGQ